MHIYIKKPKKLSIPMRYIYIYIYIYSVCVCVCVYLVECLAMFV